jgi:hypothetical protein
MIRVEFGKRTDKAVEHNIHDVKDVLVSFLESNGVSSIIALEFLKINDTESIKFQPKCSNSEWTTAIALVLLLFGEDNTTAFVKFDDRGIFIMVTDADACYDYIIDNGNAVVSYK